MQAKDVMTANVIAVPPDKGVRDIAGLLLRHRISAVPVVDADRRVLGLVSEGDLVRRPENETESRHAWWLEAFFAPPDKATAFIKSHGRTAAEVMTRNVITVTEQTPLHEIARLLEKHHIKRVPVIRDGRLVGIVSRANLLHGLAAGADRKAGPVSVDDQGLREQLLRLLAKEAGLDTALINVVVSDGVVRIWGIVASAAQKKAAEIAAESLPGVTSVENHLGMVPEWMWAD